MTSASAKSVPRRLGIVMGFLALAAVPALGLSAFAAADTGTPGTEGQQGTRPPHPVLTDTQKQCLVEHGVTLPSRPAADGTAAPAAPADDQHAAFRQAAVACGFPAAGALGPGFARPGWTRPQLTDAQKQCLADHGVTLPQRPAAGSVGERPSAPTAAQRDALQKAAAACGITIPEHGPGRAFSAHGAAV